MGSIPSCLSRILSPIMTTFVLSGSTARAKLTTTCAQTELPLARSLSSQLSAPDAHRLPQSKTSLQKGKSPAVPQSGWQVSKGANRKCSECRVHYRVPHLSASPLWHAVQGQECEHNSETYINAPLHPSPSPDLQEARVTAHTPLAGNGTTASSFAFAF